MMRIRKAHIPVVVILHPQPHQSANERGLSYYFDFLRELAQHYRDELWQATPHEIVRRYRDSLMGTNG